MGIPDYDKIITRLRLEVSEREGKMAFNQNEPSRFYYHRKQWAKKKSMLAQWEKEYEQFKLAPKGA